MSEPDPSPQPAPPRRDVRIGFIPLTDCATVIMAALKGFDARHGIRIVLSKQASWAAVRDKLIGGELDAAQLLYGMASALQLGIGGPREDMAVLMTLSRNGQAITLSRQLAMRGALDGPSLARVMANAPREYTFAQTFPTGTHAMWLYYWLAAYGIDPLRDVRLITVPPPQMVSGLNAGAMDGFCAGEPWNQRAIAAGAGVTIATSQQIWPDHPEKVLATTRGYVQRHPHAARALVAALLEAARWIDASDAHRAETAAALAAPQYLDTPPEMIAPRLLGHYENGLGRQWTDPHPVRFHDGGRVNFPYLSDAIWFMTQQRRWGLLAQDPDYLAVAGALNQVALYREAAAQVGVAVPDTPMRSSRLIDGVAWDGSEPAAYAARFEIRAHRQRNPA